MTYNATLRDYTIGEAEEWYWAAYGGALVTSNGYRGRRVDYLARHGVAVDGGDWARSSLIEIDLLHTSNDPATVEQAAARLREACAPQTDGSLVDLTVDLPSGVFVVYGRPLPPEVSTASHDLGQGRARFAFEMTDPLRYGAIGKSASVTVAASASGGMDTPMDTPMVTAAGSGGTGDVTVTNDGSADAPWKAFLTGPLTTPRLILGGKTITLDGAIATGSTALVDSRDGSVLVDGAPQPWVTVDSTWWEIPPGSSTFSFRAAAGTGTALLAWRDASF